MSDLKPCPCGKTPNKLHVIGQGEKWAYCVGDCCGEWSVEFLATYARDRSLDTLAVSAWNWASRGGQQPLSSKPDKWPAMTNIDYAQKIDDAIERIREKKTVRELAVVEASRRNAKKFYDSLPPELRTVCELGTESSCVKSVDESRLLFFGSDGETIFICDSQTCCGDEAIEAFIKSLGVI